jgi:hypothetical protein
MRSYTVPPMRRWPLLLVVLFSFISFGGIAAADLASDLNAAESRVASAKAEVAAAEQRLSEARVDYAGASRRADPPVKAARAAREEVRELREKLADQQRAARTEIARLEATHEQEEEEHDDEVAQGVGVGLALLAAALIALAWGWFRATAAVAALVRMQLGQAVALCVGGGFLLLVVGGALAAGDGLAAMLGVAIGTLGIALPVALLLGRHSAEVQRGRSKPLLSRDRLPRWVPRVAAALLLVLGLAGLIGGATAENPDAPSISQQLRQEAEEPEEGSGAARLAEAKTEAVEAAKEAAAPLAQERAARVDLRKATRELRRARNQLVGAQADTRRFASRLASLVKREEREAARAEREAEAQAERETEEAEEAEEEFFEEEAAGCDPNYSPCVPAYPPDVDCVEVGGSVSVVGSDPHGLDADSDGIGCE